MRKTFETLSLQDAKRLLAAGEARAEQIGIPYDIAVVDAGGHLVSCPRNTRYFVAIKMGHHQGVRREHI